MKDNINEDDGYCIICGNFLRNKSSGDFCSEECAEQFRCFKQSQNLQNINGFCNFCGKAYLLEKNHNGTVLHRHLKCYLHIAFKAKNNTSYDTNEKKSIIVKQQQDKEERQKILAEKKSIIVKQQQDKEERQKILAERSSFLLSRNQLYDEDTHLLVCPICSTYSVRYCNDSNRWKCSICKKFVDVRISLSRFNLDFTDKDKYKIYKLCGIEALVNLTGKSKRDVQNFISSYFEHCCTAKGNDCFYISHFEDVVAISKKIRYIESMFSEAIMECLLLTEEIGTFRSNISEDCSLNVMQKKEFYNEILLLKEMVERIIKELDECLIPYADSELMKGQKVYLEINDEKLIAHSEKVGETEAFCWIDAKKGELAGVCVFPPDALNEVKLMLYELENKYDTESSSARFFKKLDEFELSKLELDVLSTLAENGGCLQNKLWRKFDIDSRKCSRVIKSLIDKKLVVREDAIDNAARTYMLKINI